MLTPRNKNKKTQETLACTISNDSLFSQDSLEISLKPKNKAFIFRNSSEVNLTEMNQKVIPDDVDDQTAKIDYKKVTHFGCLDLGFSNKVIEEDLIWYAAYSSYLNDDEFQSDILNENVISKVIILKDFALTYEGNKVFNIIPVKSKSKCIYVKLYSIKPKDLNAIYKSVTKNNSRELNSDYYKIIKEGDIINMSDASLICLGYYMNHKIVSFSSVVSQNIKHITVKKSPNCNFLFKVFKSFTHHFSSLSSEEELLQYLYNTINISTYYSSYSSFKQKILYCAEDAIQVLGKLKKVLSIGSKITSTKSISNTYGYNLTNNTTKEDIPYSTISNINNNFNITLVKEDCICDKQISKPIEKVNKQKINKDIYVVMHKNNMNDSIDNSSAASSSIISQMKNKKKIVRTRSSIGSEILIETNKKNYLINSTSLKTPIKKKNNRYYN